MPEGMPHCSMAAWAARASSSHTPGCPGCPFTTTGQPAPKAATVSVPTTEMAKGKLLAPKTTTGPMGESMRRTSGLGSGWRSAMAVSIRASTHDPSRISSANNLAWLTARALSPVRRGMGRPVS